MKTSPRRHAFTLIELLVVIGIIALLMSMLLPAVHRAKQAGMQVKCAAQMRDVGMALLIYSNDNRGWLYPVGEYVPPTGGKPGYYKTLGTETEWYPLFPDPSNPNTYKGRHLRWPNYVDLGKNPKVWNPPILICPSDDQPGEEHTYILNKHLATRVDRLVRAGGSIRGRSTSDIVLMGEKRTESDDYYMGSKEDKDPSKSEFDIVEPYKHGIKVGSNYLYLDNSVRLQPPTEMQGALDPWSVWVETGTPTDPAAPPTTPTTPGPGGLGS